MPGAVGPKGLAELTEGPGPLPGRGVGHAPVGRPQSVIRLPQGAAPSTAPIQSPGTQGYGAPGSIPDKFGLCQYIIRRLQRI